MGQRASYLRPKQEDGAELIIHGTVYDITHFKHPGGSIIMNQVNPKDAKFPADATLAFENMHGHSKAPREALAKLRKEGKSRKLTLDEIAAIKELRPYDDQLTHKFHRVTRKLRDEGLFDYSVSHFLYRNFELFALLFWGAWCVVDPGKYLGKIHGALVLGLFMQRSGWFQHEANHGSTSTNHKFNIFVGTFWFGIGLAGSAQWWRRAHNRHHADPQRHGADVDMDTLPLAVDSLTAKNGRPFVLRIQHWLYQQMVWGLVHFWQLWLHPQNIYRNVAWLDAFFLAMHWGLWLGFFGPRIGYLQALILHVVSSSIEASLLFTNFALSHTTMPFIEFNLREHWVERSLRRTVDIHSHSKSVGPVLGPFCDNAVDFIMGYLNYQVVHHLWPLLPHYRSSDPRVLAAVEQLAAEVPQLDMHYNVTTYWRAMYDFYNNLSRIAWDHGAKRDFSVTHPQAPDWVKGSYNHPQKVQESYNHPLKAAA